MAIAQGKPNILELRNRATEAITKLSLSKLSSAVDYIEFLVDKTDDEMTQNERLAQALLEVAKDRKGQIQLPTLDEVLEESKNPLSTVILPSSVWNESDIQVFERIRAELNQNWKLEE